MVSALPLLPKRVVAAGARRYVAGAALENALEVVTALASNRRLATIDVLGENYQTPEQSNRLTEEYLRIVDLAAGYGAPSLSVMMTGLGMNVNRSLCRENLMRVVEAADHRDLQITINMEDSSTTDETLAAYRTVRDAGHDHVGIVLQASLRRSAADVEALRDLKPRVRIVKGIWVEPYGVAFDDFDVIRSSYLHILESLLAIGSYVEIATHDTYLVEEANRLLEKYEYGPDQYEFQMLLGVRPEIGDVLIAEGRKVRVYVPYGDDWYEYCLRRLKESPQFARHAMRGGVAALLGSKRNSTS